MKLVKRIDIVINAVEREHLYKLLKKLEMNNYTLFEEVKGRGDRGWQDGAGLTDSFKNICVMLACSQEDFDKMQEPLREFLRKVGGICLVSDAQWLNH